MAPASTGLLEFQPWSLGPQKPLRTGTGVQDSRTFLSLCKTSGRDEILLLELFSWSRSVWQLQIRSIEFCIFSFLIHISRAIRGFFPPSIFLQLQYYDHLLPRQWFTDLVEFFVQRFKSSKIRFCFEKNFLKFKIK